MIKFISKKFLPQSGFAHNVMILMTGTIVAQAVPIAVSPILTRLYTPDDFGLLALYGAITAILFAISTGQYELAVMLPEKDEDAINVAAIPIGTVSFFTVITFICVYFFNQSIRQYIDNAEIAKLLYCLPITVLLIGIYQVCCYWSIRKKHFKRLAVNKVFKAAAITVVNLIVGISGIPVNGLIFGEIAGQAVAAILLGQKIWQEDRGNIKQLSIDRIGQQAIRYKKFPIYSMPATLINVMSNQIPLFMLAFFLDQLS